MVFVVFGLIFGPIGLGRLGLRFDAELLAVLAELTLALVLFTDAAGTDLVALNRVRKLPIRLLGLGLPLTILLGFGVGTLLFGSLSLLEISLIATILAPTDAALGQAVITNKAVPNSYRQVLSAESGLNDGICVPILFLFLILINDHSGEAVPWQVGLGLFAKVVGIGLLVGVGCAFSAAILLRFSSQRGWLSKGWSQISVVALAFTCFAAAESLGGSGFIASFSGGLLFGVLVKDHHETLLEAGEDLGRAFALLTWILFGAGVVGQSFSYLTWPIVLYALLSLTVIRMLPAFLVTAGLGMSKESRLFVGWFGPRGLASIVFGVIVLEEHLEHSDTISAVVVCTVMLSIVLHGVTANPWAKTFGVREARRS